VVKKEWKTCFIRGVCRPIGKEDRSISIMQGIRSMFSWDAKGREEELDKRIFDKSAGEETFPTAIKKKGDKK